MVAVASGSTGRRNSTAVSTISSGYLTDTDDVRGSANMNGSATAMPRDDLDDTLGRVQEWINGSHTYSTTRPLYNFETNRSPVNWEAGRDQAKPCNHRKTTEPQILMDRTPTKTVVGTGLEKEYRAQSHVESMTPEPQHLFNEICMRSASKTSSHKTSGQSSPTKRKADFDITYPKIIFNEGEARFTDQDWKFPDRIRLAAISIPTELRQDLEAHPVARRDLSQVVWQENHGRSVSEIQRLWKKVQQINKAAATCSTEARPEESWSDKVVLKILRLAMKWSGLRPKVMVANLKSVQVDEPALLPTRNLKRVVSEKVDYGLCLQPDAEEEVVIENVLRNMPDDLPSINQSSTPMLRKRRLFCNLKIKNPYGNQDPAPQLGVWCTAGLAKMSNLARDSRRQNEELPILQEPAVSDLPCWSVDRHRWQLYMGRRVSSAETVIQGSFLTYNTNVVVEIIFLVNALSEILQWGNSTFRQWLMTVVSGARWD